MSVLNIAEVDMHCYFAVGNFLESLNIHNPFVFSLLGHLKTLIGKLGNTILILTLICIYILIIFLYMQSI